MNAQNPQSERSKSNKLRERFKREVCEALKQISGCVGLPCSPHNYESVKTEAVVNELCDSLVNIADDQLARAIHNFDFGVGVSVRKPNV